MSEFRPVIQLSTLNGRNGFHINGDNPAYNRSGGAVASAGDINGDGFDDVIIGDALASPHGKYEGAAYVVFGREGGFPANLQLSSLNGRDGFQISGEPGSRGTGGSVASAGDLDGDGLDDVIIGAAGADPHGSNSGASYVVYGRKTSFPATVELSNLNGGNGFQINGETAGDFSGSKVAPAGDVNGDGFDDVIIGASGADPHGSSSGASYVIFGKAGSFGANFDLANLNGGNGFQINGERAGDYSGGSVASAGDVDGDGYDDVMIGASGADPNGLSSGAAYVVFGKVGGFTANLPLSNLNGGNGFQLSGEMEDYSTGNAVASAGDVNGDGFADLVIGAVGADPNHYNTGASYVVFGKAGSFAANLQLSNLNGRNGFQINGEAVMPYSFSGTAVASAGDVNGDGFDDVIIGAPALYAHGRYVGASYVVFGKASRFAATLEESSLNGDNGFKLNGEGDPDGVGAAVASGDVNGDGFADLIAGAPDNASYYSNGGAYVVFGHRANDAVNRIGTANDDTINGGRGDDTIRGLMGDDRLVAWEGNDLVFGGRGRDWLSGRSGFDRLIGGTGPDFLIGGLGNDVFDFNSVTDSGTTADTRDVIRDFAHAEDKIDLSDLGSLTFIGTAAFTAPGQVRVVQQGPNTIVEVNLSGDAAPEMTIALLDVAAATFTREDFIL